MERGTNLTAQIIIGTPGTVLDWGLKFKFFDLKKIKIFTLDEADVMIDTQGHHDQTLRIRRFVLQKAFCVDIRSRTLGAELDALFIK